MPSFILPGLLQVNAESTMTMVARGKTNVDIMGS